MPPKKDADAFLRALFAEDDQIPSTARVHHLMQESGVTDLDEGIMHGMTALNIAVSNDEDGDCTGLVTALVAARADVNKVNVHGMSSLHIAVGTGKPDIARALLRAKADVDRPCAVDQGRTPLVSALISGNDRCVRVLMEGRADVNRPTTDGGHLPLFMAAGKQNLGHVRALLAAKADVNAGNGVDGTTALLAAAEVGSVPCARALIDAKANVCQARSARTGGATPLTMAAQQNHVGCLKTLIDAKADVDQATSQGFTALLQAAEQGWAECTRVLIAAKAKLDPRAYDDCTPLFMAAQHGQSETLRILIEAGADINVVRSNGESALMAASSGVHLLQTENGVEITDIAVNKRLECVRLLIRAGAKLEKTFGNKSAADLARDHPAILNELRKICSECKKGLEKRYFCGKCYTVAYCSEACQEAAWPEHEAECTERRRCDACRWGMADEASVVKCCSAAKDAKAKAKVYCNDSCRRLGWAKHKDECVERQECGGCRLGCPLPLKLCAACGVVRYCSVACQRKDWTAGHRTACAKKKKK